eukprot:g19898.t1
MREEIAARYGTNLQLQRELDDLCAQENPDGPADPDDVEEQVDREEPEVVVTDMAPPPPRASRSLATASPSVRQFMMKEQMRSWTNADHAQRWFITATRPVAVALSMPGMESMMHATVKVTKPVLDMLTTWVATTSGSSSRPGTTRRYPTGGSPKTSGYSFALSSYYSPGVSSNVGRARLAILPQGLQSGLHTLTQRCVECCRQMRIPENADVMADYVNLDLNRWVGQLYDMATDFTAANYSPPSAEEFPPVVVPEWTRLSEYISAGGLRNSQHQPPRAKSVPPGFGRGHSSAATPSGKKGYRFAWASAEGCPRSASECWYAHSHDPNPTGKRERKGAGAGAAAGTTIAGATPLAVDRQEADPLTQGAAVVAAPAAAAAAAAAASFART